MTDTGRLETFADGVFAIAITLLVLGIRVPSANEDLAQALGAQWPSFFAYVVSFLTIGVMWVQHHRLFTVIGRSNQAFAMINVVFLLFIAFIPFPTDVVAQRLASGYDVLGATLLFLLQQRVTRRISGAAADEHEPARVLPRPSWWFVAAQFGVAVYGGYFGAAIGILMLATLGAMGLTNIHRMNGLKNWGGLCINAVAAATFAVSGIVNWPVAVTMAAGGLAGGYAGARLALRVGQKWVRRAVVVIGFSAFVWLMLLR